jgi:hypothetical protein
VLTYIGIAFESMYSHEGDGITDSDDDGDDGGTSSGSEDGDNDNANESWWTENLYKMPASDGSLTDVVAVSDALVMQRWHN